MRHIIPVLAVAALMVTMLVVVAGPAAAGPGDTIVFFPVPLGNGAIYSCTGGPPFVFDSDSTSTGNCAVQQIGRPPDLVCDVPTTITFVHDMHQFVGDASRCQSGTDESVAPA